MVLGFPANFGIRARSDRAAGFVGGAYVYIDPTPSKNVFKVNIDVVPRNIGTIPARVAHGVSAAPRLGPCGAGGAWGDGMNASPAHAGARHGAKACHPPAVPMPAPASSIPPVAGYYVPPAMTDGLLRT